MAEPYKHIYKVDLNQQLVRRDVGLLATFDSKANRFGSELYRDGASVSASGYEVMGYFIRPDDETVNCPGTVEGNLVYVDLLPGCYLYEGTFDFTLKIKQGEEEKAVLMCYGNVVRSRTDATAEGGEVVVTVTNADNLGGKPPKYYLPAVQLLDNPDFAIAQAGYNGLHGSTRYAADRWSTGENGVLTVSGEIKTYTSNSGYVFMSQNLWNDGRDKGKSYTLAIELGDGTVRACSGTVPSYDVSSQTVIAEMYIAIAFSALIIKEANGCFVVRLDAQTNGATASFKHVWLVEGTYTAETLPPFAPLDHTLELAKCQSLFVPISIGGIHTGLIGSSGNVNINVDTPFMKGARSVAGGENLSFAIVTPIGIFAVTGFTVSKYDEAATRITAYEQSESQYFNMPFTAYTMSTSGNAYISADP